ncbi:hypothetical protein AWT69_004997 [Pseudomonas putida]|nr:hypothetical protein AWT69_004997 [Pseudomonas putida]
MHPGILWPCEGRGKRPGRKSPDGRATVHRWTCPVPVVERSDLDAADIFEIMTQSSLVRRGACVCSLHICGQP